MLYFANRSRPKSSANERPPHLSAPGERQGRNVDDVAEEERHLEARFDSESRDHLQEFLDRRLEFATCQVLAQASMDAVAERDMCGAAIQPDLVGGFIALGC